MGFFRGAQRMSEVSQPRLLGMALVVEGEGSLPRIGNASVDPWKAEEDAVWAARS